MIANMIFTLTVSRTVVCRENAEEFMVRRRQETLRVGKPEERHSSIGNVDIGETDRRSFVRRTFFTDYHDIICLYKSMSSRRPVVL